MRKSWVRVMLGPTLATALMSGATPASAQGGGGLQVSPIRLDLGAKQRGGALTLTNTSESKKTIQVDVVGWTQRDEEDVYAPTRDLLANPPVFFLEPGASQVVRVGLASSAMKPSATERPYRVFLREVAEDRPIEGSALRVVVRLGVPVFVAPAAASNAAPKWHAHLQKDGSVNLVLDNPGVTHLRGAQLKLLGEKGEAIGADASLRYVLAGSHQTWHVKPATAVRPGPARISVLMEDGAREFPVVVQAD